MDKPGNTDGKTLCPAAVSSDVPHTKKSVFPAKIMFLGLLGAFLRFGKREYSQGEQMLTEIITILPLNGPPLNLCVNSPFSLR